MIKLKNIVTAAARLKRSKGFGIHSPFAFNFVVNVLRLSHRYRYYAYDVLPSGVARMIFRIANYYNPPVVTEIGAGCFLGPFESRKSEAFPQDSMPFVIVNLADETKTSRLHEIASGYGVIIVCNIGSDKSLESLWNSLTVNLPSGMSFTNSKTGILVASPKLPRQHFALWL